MWLVLGHSRSSAEVNYDLPPMSPFDRGHMTYDFLFSFNILYLFRDIATHLSKVADFNRSHMHLAPRSYFANIFGIRKKLRLFLCNPMFSHISRYGNL